MFVPTVPDILRIVRPLGPPPIGSPADLRIHAARLRTIADGAALARSLLQQAANMPEASGPAADRFRHDIEHERAMLDQRLERVRALAAYLDQQASLLEQQQRRWKVDWLQRTGGFPGHLVRQALSGLGWKLP